MVKIKITRGVFGWKHEGLYSLVPAGSEIEVDKETAERLVSKGAAEVISAPLPEPAETKEERDLTGMTLKELRALGKEMGVLYKVGMTKAEYAEAIQSAEAADAPTFDAADAVL